MQNRSTVQSLNGVSLSGTRAHCGLSVKTLSTDRAASTSDLCLLTYPRGIPLSTAVTRDDTRLMWAGANESLEQQISSPT